MNLDRLLADPERARKLKPRDWQRLDRELREVPHRERVGEAHDRQRRRTRPPLESVVCVGCGAELAVVRSGDQVWCPACRVWSGGVAERGVLG